MKKSNQPERGEKKCGEKKWSSKSLGSRAQHTFFYNILRVFGLGPARCILFFVVLYYCLRPKIYKRSKFYIVRRFKKCSFLGNFSHVFKLYWQFGVILLERAAGGILKNIKISSKSEYAEEIIALLEEKKGLILLSGHVGCWQVALSGIHFNAPINLVQLRDNEDVDRHFFEHDENSSFSKIKIISSAKDDAGFISITSALLRGEIVCLMGDRLLPTEKVAVSVNFLGGKITIPGSAYLLASKTGAPIAITFSYRTGVCSATNYIYTVMHVPAKLKKTQESLEPYAQQFATGLEKFTETWPYQFFNFHDFWVKD